MTSERSYDVVLLGATGFAGELTAEYLAGAVPPGCRWALAGRNENKLADVRKRLSERNPACADLPLLHADSTDEASLRKLAESTRVLITTVGPYVQYGEPLVAACAAAGTDYVDLTGEPEFVDRMYLRHHETAVRNGARIVHACGFDSIPYDLGVYHTVRQLPAERPVTITGQVRTNASFSGGTYASVLTALSRPRQMADAAKQRRRVETRPENRRIHTPLGSPRRDHGSGMWLAPMPTLDPRIVARSAAALPEYGPDFTYRQYAAVKRLPVLVGGIAGLGALGLLAQIPPARRALATVRAPGTGPAEQDRAKSWFSVRFTGEAGGQQVQTEFAGGDPGYDETAKMLAESALCLAFDDLPSTAGQVTAATAMGSALLERLRTAGLTIRTLP
ncbi:saccharopine dehydrogenase NADP-binding domain-containing protein [Saccharopolyspora sp. HNM0986]|uniref:saccharopine dehydrogenase family protein n=1 Tax=Saccharopolyspora galaxeae TaxID=2781241 RepID=UPI00190C8F71|nr:saccharopine dehydrogenase NADP-binding domain-containing protein [Saccharopolyspora sp. HNM0986]MBK0869044.1 saccharopine dehydrogenase NADP-binding domain-containing protein [Saccharopolyspora sp. HNM0986]